MNPNRHTIKGTRPRRRRKGHKTSGNDKGAHFSRLICRHDLGNMEDGVINSLLAKTKEGISWIPEDDRQRDPFRYLGRLQHHSKSSKWLNAKADQLIKACNPIHPIHTKCQ